jgi:hypothetical protein
MLIFKGTVLLITLRTFTEYGFANGIRYSLLEIVTRAIGIIAIFFTLVTFKSGTINQRNRILSAAVFFTIIICTLNGLKNFPWDSALSEELVRLLAVYAFYVLASRFTAIPAPAIRRYLLFACTLPGIIVLGTFLLGSEIFRSGSDRATGTFAHSNSAAAYLGVSAIVCIAIFFEVRNKLFLVFFLINIIAIGTTQSLTSLVGVVFAMAIIGLNNPKIKSSLKKNTSKFDLDFNHNLFFIGVLTQDWRSIFNRLQTCAYDRRNWHQYWLALIKLDPLPRALERITSFRFWTRFSFGAFQSAWINSTQCIRSNAR